MYLLRSVNYAGETAADRKEQRWLEFTLFFIIIIIGFVGSIFGFNAAGYRAEFHKQVTVQQDGKPAEITEKIRLCSAAADQVLRQRADRDEAVPWHDGADSRQTPGWMKGAQAGRKLNTVIWSVLSGIVLYALLRLIARKPLGAAISPLLKGMDGEDLDEIGYRAIAIGYPIFTLGALIFCDDLGS